MPAISVPASPPLDVYVLAGQSNMSGRGDPTELAPEDRRIDEAILLYGNDGRWRFATEPLDDPSGQIDVVSRDRNAGVGPGLSFARALRARTGRRIGLLPCARGGSALSEWAPEDARNTLYGSCLARIREVGGRVMGVLWYQGETDAKDAALARTWSARFGAMVSALRHDVGQPDLPVTLVELADRPSANARRFPAWNIVRRQQRRAARISRAAIVSAAGLSLNPDGLHLSTSAQITLGQRLADTVYRRGLATKQLSPLGSQLTGQDNTTAK